MGWSLKGIIGGALVGGAGAAEKHFVAEDNMARELATKKEMADYTSEIEFNKKQRLQEWADTHGDEVSAKNRAETGKLMSSATDYAKEQGHKFGSQGWYESTADYLVRQGRTDLAKDVYGQVNSVRADDTKDQIANMRKEMAAERAARGSGGGGGGGGGKGGETSGQVDLDSGIKHIGAQFINEEGKKAEGGEGYAAMLFDRAIKDPRVEGDPKQALRLVREQVAEANAQAIANKTSTIFETTQLIKQASDAGKQRKADALRMAPNVGPESGPESGSNMPKVEKGILKNPVPYDESGVTKPKSFELGFNPSSGTINPGFR